MNTAKSSSQVTSQTLPDANLSLNEMLRVMDVAREMRTNREMAEQVLARDEVRSALRSKLKRSAEISGDRVTEAEIDAAIDTYFADRHRYQDPKFSLNLLVAHLWIRRTAVLSVALIGLVSIAAVWGLFMAPFAPLSPSRNAARAVLARQADAQQLVDQIKAVSLLPEITASAERLAEEVKVAGAADPTTAMATLETLRQLHQQLLESYKLRIASDQDGSNLVERGIRENGDMVSGYYVLVEAVDPSGKVVPIKVRNAETQKDETAKIWGERIPFEVFERLRIDKQADGIMDESEFGLKERGRTDAQVTMVGQDGEPLKRSTQITNW